MKDLESVFDKKTNKSKKSKVRNKLAKKIKIA